MEHENLNTEETANSDNNVLANRLPCIFIGEKQPVECDNCKSKEGYEYSDFMKLHYTTFHDKEGKHDGGHYSESGTILNKGITPYCLNCGERLKFKLIRESIEELEAKKHHKNSFFV
jgi:hypothetical protein